MTSRTRNAVLYATDANFWDHTFVSIYSLLANNTDLGFDIWIMSEQPNPEFFEHCQVLHEMHGDVGIQWLPVNTDMFRNAPATRKITMATYYRLLLGELLPNDISRLLYIDGDTIVRKSIQPLLDQDISNVVLAGIPEYIPLSKQPPLVPHPVRLGLPEGAQCFNAGVLYINLDMWRDQDIGQQSVDYVLEHLTHPTKLQLRDQDALNATLTGKWLPVGPYFNHAEWCLDEQRFTDRTTLVTSGSMIPADGPLIAHYTGPVKPWDGGSGHTYASEYWHYRMQTPYFDRRAFMRTRLAGMPYRARRQVVKVARRIPYGDSMLRVVSSRWRAA